MHKEAGIGSPVPERTIQRPRAKADTLPAYPLHDMGLLAANGKL